MTNVILADDRDIFRVGVARLLTMEADVRILAHCREAIADATVIVASKLLPKSIDLLARVEAQEGHSIVIDRARRRIGVLKNYLRVVFNKVGVTDRLELALFTFSTPSLATAAAAVHLA